jgi:hypothetical protein
MKLGSGIFGRLEPMTALRHGIPRCGLSQRRPPTFNHVTSTVVTDN